MELKLDSEAILNGLRSGTERQIRKLLTAQNPAYVDAVKMDRYTGNLKPELTFYQATPDGLICPRGAAAKLFVLCRRCGETIDVVDNRLELDLVDFHFHGDLRPLQADAVADVMKRDQGTLAAPTGSGKTCMGLFIIAERKQPALIICHTKEIQNQWISAIEKFLGIHAHQVGVIGGGGKPYLGKQITVALVQSLYSRLNDVTPYIGQVVVDECHRAPSRMFTDAVTAFPAKFRLGLTATPWRRDGLSKVIFWHLGDVTGEISKQDLLKNGNLCQAEAVFIPTGFTPASDPSESYSKALSELTLALGRNRLIVETVTRHNGTGINLILSDRREHCEALASILKENKIQAAVLTGQTATKKREQIIQDLQSGKCHYLVATGQLIGEGFDLPEITTLALATPVKFSGRLIQYAGRALRPAPGKDKALILDFVDSHPVFKASARARQSEYKWQRIRTVVASA